jgi:hypothetical protein
MLSRRSKKCTPTRRVLARYSIHLALKTENISKLAKSSGTHSDAIENEVVWWTTPSPSFSGDDALQGHVPTTISMISRQVSGRYIYLGQKLHCFLHNVPMAVIIIPTKLCHSTKQLDERRGDKSLCFWALGSQVRDDIVSCG